MKTAAYRLGILSMVLLILASCSARAYDLSATFLNLAEATDEQALAQAALNTRVKYSNAPVLTAPGPASAVFEGFFIPASSTTKLALFSADGANVYVDGDLVISGKNTPQSLSDPSQSFKEIPLRGSTSICSVQIQAYRIRIEYSDMANLPPYGINGATLYAYDGGGRVCTSYNV